MLATRTFAILRFFHNEYANDETFSNEMSTTFPLGCVGVDIARSATNHLVTLIGTGFYQSDGVHSHWKKQLYLLLTNISTVTLYLHLVFAMHFR